MSQPVKALAPLPFELVYSDGEPLETQWHVLQMNLLIEVIFQAMVERDRRDFFVGGDMFVYYSYQQARDIVAGRSYFRGPDVFYVGGVAPGERKAWISWEEGDRLPEMIVELLSPSTAKIDRTVKKDLYAEVWRTPEYFLYERETHTLEGFRLSGRLSGDTYRPIPPNAAGRLPSEVLGLELGFWEGEELGVQTAWLRLFDADGRLVPTREEAARQHAQTERQRADTAEAELARLRALLAGNTEKGGAG